MNIYSLKQIVAIAKYTSPIYKQLYMDVDPATELKDLPILTNEALMTIVHDKRPDFVFAEGNTHGIIFESSASTGKPKVTIWGRDEWEGSMRILSTYHWKNSILRDGDRVANLCASPYLSYRIVHGAIEHFPGHCSEVPIGCDLPFLDLHNIIEKYKCNVLAGVNSTFLGLAWTMLKNDIINDQIERIVAGGELLYGSQMELIKKAFPRARMISFLFGTTESGIIAYSLLSDAMNEFRPFKGVSIVEILDEETQTPIYETGRVGKCVVTSLLRVAAPAIRIDTGDYASWVEPPYTDNTKFRIHGRKFPFHISIQDSIFSETDIWNFIQALSNKIELTKLQAELHNDRLEIVYATLFPMQNVSKIIKEVLFEKIPILLNSRIDVTSRQESFDYFIESTRRKGRLLKDCRK